MSNGDCPVGSANKADISNIKDAIDRIDRAIGRIFVGQLAVLTSVIAGLVITIITRI